MGLEKAGVEIATARAVIADAEAVRLMPAGTRIEAKHILIATGSAPFAGDAIPGAACAISSDQAFDLKTFPGEILIQGGGYIAIEFACIFAGLGSKVTLVYRGHNILRGFDDDVRSHLRGEMENRGIAIVTGRTVAAIEPRGGRLSRSSMMGVFARRTKSCSRSGASPTLRASASRRSAYGWRRTEASPSMSIREHRSPRSMPSAM